MGVTGTDVSKEAAAMILTDDNFASIVAAVEEGRGIVGNIKKYLMFLLSSNIGEIGLMTATSLVGLPLPLTAVQILYVNLATDGLHMPYLVRDVEQIAAEFAADGQPYGVFIDNNLGSRPDYLRELCRGLRPLERIWSAAVTIDVTDDPSLVREMALAGCTGVFVGFESLANENIVDAHKKSPRTEDYARRVRILHDHGIQVNGSFVLGFDHDRPDVFERTAEWIEAVAASSRWRSAH